MHFNEPARGVTIWIEAFLSNGTQIKSRKDLETPDESFVRNEPCRVGFILLIDNKLPSVAITLVVTRENDHNIRVKVFTANIWQASNVFRVV